MSGEEFKDKIDNLGILDINIEEYITCDEFDPVNCPANDCDEVHLEGYEYAGQYSSPNREDLRIKAAADGADAITKPRLTPHNGGYMYFCYAFKKLPKATS